MCALLNSRVVALVQAIIDFLRVSNDLLEGGEAEDGRRYDDRNQPNVNEGVTSVLDAAEQTLVPGP